MFLSLHMKLNSAAFFDIDGTRDGTEVARILHRLAEQVDGTPIEPDLRGPLFDHSGNHVGTWQVVALRDGDE